MSRAVTWRTKNYLDSFGCAAHFGTRFTALDSASVSVAVLSGLDSAPASVLSGAPQISGTDILQRISGGVVGCTYLITFTATSGSDIESVQAILGVSDEP